MRKTIPEGKENNSNADDVPNSIRFRSAATQTSPPKKTSVGQRASEKPRASGEHLEGPIIVELGFPGGSMNGVEQSAEGRFQINGQSSVRAAFVEGPSSDGQAFTTARDGRAPSLLTGGGGMPPVSGGIPPTSAAAECLSTGGFAGEVNAGCGGAESRCRLDAEGEAGGSARGESEKLTGGAALGGETGVSEQGRKRKLGEEAAEGRGKKRAKKTAPNECGCAEIAEEEHRAFARRRAAREASAGG